MKTGNYGYPDLKIMNKKYRSEPPYFYQPQTPKGTLKMQLTFRTPRGLGPKQNPLTSVL